MLFDEVALRRGKNSLVFGVEFRHFAWADHDSAERTMSGNKVSLNHCRG